MGTGTSFRAFCLDGRNQVTLEAIKPGFDLYEITAFPTAPLATTYEGRVE